MIRLTVIALSALIPPSANAQSGTLMLSTSASEVSASAGGIILYEIQGTGLHAGDPYSLMMAFRAGTFEFGNSTVPIALDALSFFTFFNPLPPPLVSQGLSGNIGQASESAGAIVGVPPGALVGLEGMVLHLAAVTWVPGALLTDATNAVTLTITP